MGEPDSATGNEPSVPSPEVFCPECGYNLRGIQSERCPECGEPFDFEDLAKPQIPWVHRKEIGRIRAYWKTVFLVMFRNRRFCQEINRPVSYADSQSFRWVTILHVHLPWLLVTAALYAAAPTNPFGSEALDWAYHAIWPVVIVHLSLMLFLAAATGVPSYFFHPKEASVLRQNRAIALNYYAAAPLAWAPLAYVLTILSWFAHALSAPGLVWMVLFLLGTLLPMALPLVWLFELLRLAKKSLQKNGDKLLLMGAALPAVWVMLFGLVAIGLPAIVFYVAVIFTSIL